jgi:glycosyltransferase involved in cell wall biosynthesis
MNKISATIITYNEEKNIARCIDSLKSVADEIIVLDSFSTDRTKEICESKSILLHQRKWEGYSASKNYLNNLAEFDYILSIDADEALSSELQNSIIFEKKKGLSHLYQINRKTNYCGKWIRFSGWYPDIKTRLFPKNKCKWEGEFVHEKLVCESNLKTKLLSGDCYHFSYHSFQEHKNRADKYSILTAQKMASKGKKASFLKPYFSAILRFLSMYVLKLGFLDGKMGYKIALISAKSNILKYKELRRLNHG